MDLAPVPLRSKSPPPSATRPTRPRPIGGLRVIEVMPP